MGLPGGTEPVQHALHRGGQLLPGRQRRLCTAPLWLRLCGGPLAASKVLWSGHGGPSREQQAAEGPSQ